MKTGGAKKLSEYPLAVQALTYLVLFALALIPTGISFFILKYIQSVFNVAAQ